MVSAGSKQSQRDPLELGLTTRAAALLDTLLLLGGTVDEGSKLYRRVVYASTHAAFLSMRFSHVPIQQMGPETNRESSLPAIASSHAGYLAVPRVKSGDQASKGFA